MLTIYLSNAVKNHFQYIKPVPYAIISLLALGFTNCSYLPKTAKNTDILSSAKLLSVVPFTTLTSGIAVLRLQLNNIPDTLNFILDTGSGGISLDSSIVNYYRLPVSPSVITVKGIGSVKKVNYVLDQTLKLPNLQVRHLDFHINNYGLLSSIYGVRIDGIIGFSFLNRYIVKIDYDRNLLKVLSIGKCSYPRNSEIFRILKPANNGIPAFEIIVSNSVDHPGRFYLDSGAGLDFLMSEDYVTDNSILKKDNKMIVTQAEGLGGKTSMKLSTIKEIRIGRFTFKKVPSHIYKDKFNVIEYPLVGGLIGSDLLRRFNLIINYQEQQICLKPNSHFRDPFDYSYTGLEIFLLDGQITIEDVLEDSPGEKAGLMPGDVIISVDDYFGANIQFYKNLLGEAGANLKIVVKRNRKIIVTNLKVGSIL